MHELPRQVPNCRAPGVEPLARAARRARRAPLHRTGLRLERVQAPARIRSRPFGYRQCSSVPAGHRHARPLRRVRRHPRRTQRPPLGDVRLARLFLLRFPRRLARRRDRPVLAGRPRLRLHRRHRPRHRLHLARLHPHQVVPRPARHGHRHRHHGIRRRRPHRLTLVDRDAGELRHRPFRHRHGLPRPRSRLRGLHGTRRPPRAGRRPTAGSPTAGNRSRRPAGSSRTPRSPPATPCAPRSSGACGWSSA